MQRTLALVIVVSIALSSLPAGVAAQSTNATAQQVSSVSITNVSVSPDDVAPGERVTITPTIQNLQNSNSNVQIDSVYMREMRLGGQFELSRVRNLGGLRPGASTNVPMTATFEEPGTKRIQIVVSVSDENDNHYSVRQQIVIDVDEQNPQLDIGVNETVATVEQQGRVTIANGLDTAAQNVALTVTGSEGLTVLNPRTVRPSLASGATTTARFRYKADTPGSYRIRALMTYNVPGGQTRRTETSVPVEVKPLKRNVVIDATNDRDSPTVTLDVFNRGNVAIENVTITGESRNATIPQRYIGSIDAQSSRTVRINASMDGTTADVRLRATYEIADEAGSATDDVRLTQRPGEIELTGLTVQPDDGRLSITGSASNVGLTEASSVTVRVKETADVTPAAPREYFVGRVPASDFVTFEVFARTQGNVSQIPLEVTYLADGERHTRTVMAEVDSPASSSDPGAKGGSSGGLLIPAVGVIVVIGVLSAIVYGWRNRGGN